MTKWISVKERLPEFLKEVLVYSPDEDRIWFAFLREKFIYHPDTGNPLFFRVDNGLIEVSHWAFYPPKPRTEEDNKRLADIARAIK